MVRQLLYGGNPHRYAERRIVEVKSFERRKRRGFLAMFHSAVEVSSLILYDRRRI